MGKIHQNFAAVNVTDFAAARTMPDSVARRDREKGRYFCTSNRRPRDFSATTRLVPRASSKLKYRTQEVHAT